jgi:hypothetical protein
MSMVKYGAPPAQVSTKAQGHPGEKVVKPKPEEKKPKKG